MSVEAEPTAELEVHVQERLGGQVRGLSLWVTAAGIVIRGQAHTYYAKQLAQHAVMAASSLPILANEIDVR